MREPRLWPESDPSSVPVDTTVKDIEPEDRVELEAEMRTHPIQGPETSYLPVKPRNVLCSPPLGS